MSSPSAPSGAPLAIQRPAHYRAILASCRPWRGLLLYRRVAARETGERRLEVLLVHPGGPYWAKKDAGAWSIPKGEAETEELGPSRRR